MLLEIGDHFVDAATIRAICVHPTSEPVHGLNHDPIPPRCVVWWGDNQTAIVEFEDYEGARSFAATLERNVAGHVAREQRRDKEMMRMRLEAAQLEAAAGKREQS